MVKKLKFTNFKKHNGQKNDKENRKHTLKITEIMHYTRDNAYFCVKKMHGLSLEKNK